MKSKTQIFSQILTLLSLILFAVEVYAQPTQKQSKEERKQAEQQLKEQEKQAKEDAKRQRQEAETQALLERLVPVGRDIAYDRFKDTSRVTTKVMNVLSDDAAKNWGQIYVAMYGEYAVRGDVGKVPDSVNLIFTTLGIRRFFGTKLDRTVYMIIDGNQRVSLGEMRYGGQLDAKCCREVAYFTLPLKDYQTLANSKSIEVQMGSVEFAFHPRHFEGLRALLVDLPANAPAQPPLQTDKSAQALPENSFVGSWKLEIKMQNNEAFTWTLSIKKIDNTFTGIIKTDGGEIVVPNIIVSNKILGSAKIKTSDGKDGSFFIFGDFKDGNISGKITVMGAGLNSAGIFEGKRENEK